MEVILAGPAVKKILFMSSEARINNEIIPHFYACLQETDTDLTQAVPTMLEILPGGTKQRFFFLYLIHWLGNPEKYNFGLYLLCLIPK